MLNPKFIRKNQELVKKNTTERGMDPQVVERWLDVDKKFMEAQARLEDLNQQKNTLAKTGKESNDFEALREEGKKIKDAIKSVEDDLVELEREWNQLINNIPNIHRPEVPIGKNEDDNVKLRKVGKIPNFDFETKDHIELGKIHDMLDFEAGAKVSGSQFYFLKNDAVRLELALLQFGINFLEQKGFTLVMTPDMAKSRFYLGTGYAPKGDEAQIYEIDGEDLGLIATAEVTMAGLHADEILKAEDLPLKYAAVSHCFRKEAGAYGKYSKGLYRVHQFTKLEMFIYSLPEHSEAMHQEILRVEEELTQALEIPYRVLEMCSGDLGAIASRKYDLEAWMAGRGDYGEITSTSNTDDFQARNLNIRVKTEKGNEYVHMLNGTALVTSRIPIVIMENFQQKDGSIRIPKALVPYFGKEYIGK
ncbi:MAG TPA: serine--tRNA ligase [Candidatus Dojkabacteria bacterium]|nr:serine--tRNA ligase [Candidatus Dojkabacteria bacterium]HRP36298.1 serine--tRNA ligase [Candidatus Dojkabacteria bacterium]HRP51066.1 serine--tRNA ligase [Candidatus Dojkabacteria bacterium]